MLLPGTSASGSVNLRLCVPGAIQARVAKRMYMGQKEGSGAGKSAHHRNSASNSHTIASGRIIHGQILHERKPVISCFIPPLLE